ncbi:hypothetical protein GCM10027570_04150 [Streptomonospora sediminis]
MGRTCLRRPRLTGTPTGWSGAEAAAARNAGIGRPPDAPRAAAPPGRTRHGGGPVVVAGFPAEPEFNRNDGKPPV